MRQAVAYRARHRPPLSGKKLRFVPGTVRNFLSSALLVAVACSAPPERPFQLELEAGPVWQTRNDVAVPGDTGTRFALDDLTGSGPFASGRVSFDWNVDPDHGLRVVVAPLSFSGTDVLSQPVRFQDTVFAAGQPTEGRYKFNTYRLTYRYRLFADGPWEFRIGATGVIRDAEIGLEQNGTSETRTDVGFVPVVHLDGSVRLGEHWRLAADFDGFGLPGTGRLIDLALKAYYDIDETWTVGIGYRTLEGGADNDSVYTFSWLHYALLSVGVRF